ncbi:hypothetical protein LCGC14_0589580 [marine sediment metagenome]|uniref:Uncharacterized protein n=1 Tax=marine sediment metagenome TaxID=412755 RepID=A0A0F9RIS9_9ZZZZ
MATDDIAFQRYMESFPAGSIIPMTAQELWQVQKLDQANALGRSQFLGLPIGDILGAGLSVPLGSGNPFGPFPTLDPAARQAMPGNLVMMRGDPPKVIYDEVGCNWEPWLIGLEALAYLAGGLLWAWFCTVV